MEVTQISDKRLEFKAASQSMLDCVICHNKQATCVVVDYKFTNNLHVRLHACMWIILHLHTKQAQAEDDSWKHDMEQ